MINLPGCAQNGNFMRIALIPMSRGGENCNPWTCGWVMMALMVLGLVFAGELLGSVNVGQTLGDSEIWAPSITPCPLAPLLTVFTSPQNLWAQITDCPHQTKATFCKGTKKKHLETCSSDRMEDQAGRRGQGPELVLIKISISRIIRPLRCCALDLPAA